MAVIALLKILGIYKIKYFAMDWISMNLNTFIPESPQIINNNFSSFKRYLDIIYNENTGVVIVPVNTTGRVKAATGEFVNVIVDNLTVKRQFSNLYNNVTTIDSDYYNTYVGYDTSIRDASVGGFEDTDFKYIDVISPYIKIKNDVSIALKVNSVGQIVNILFDVSYGSPFNIKLNPSVLKIQAAEALLTRNLQLICINIDSSLRCSWVIREQDNDLGTPLINQTFDGSVNIGRLLTHYNNYTVTSNTPISLTGYPLIGGGAEIRMIGDGSHTPSFSAFTQSSGSDTYSTTIGAVNKVVFYYDGTNAFYSITIL